MTIDLQTVAAIIDIAGVFAAACAAAWYAFFNQKGNQRAADDVVAKNLIDNLQKSLDLTTSDLKATNVKLDQTTKELHIMQGKNEVLQDLFGGNENSIMAFVKAAPELITMTKQNSDMLAELARAVTTLVKALPSVIVPAPQLEIKS
jgi:hypothetical protein